MHWFSAQRVAEDKQTTDAKQKIHNIQQITTNNNFGRSEGAKAKGKMAIGKHKRHLSGPD